LLQRTPRQDQVWRQRVQQVLVVYLARGRGCVRVTQVERSGLVVPLQAEHVPLFPSFDRALPLPQFGCQFYRRKGSCFLRAISALSRRQRRHPFLPETPVFEN